MLELLLSTFVIVGSIVYGIYKILHPVYTVISIEGQVGSGKSTLLKKLLNTNKDLILLPEPVDIWLNTKDKDGSNMLGKFYENIPRWAYSFQNFAYITRIKILKDSIDSINKFKWTYDDLHKRLFSIPYVIVTERSIYTDKYVFAQMLYDSGSMTDLEFTLYKTWFDFFAKDYKIDHIVYVRTTPELAMKRIKTRGRPEEKDIKMEYLKNLHKYHENWLINFGGGKLNVIQLEDNDIEEDVDSQKSIDKYNNHIRKINNFIYNM
jgi:deoxyadenosine/deoxycytidine kinase